MGASWGSKTLETSRLGERAILLHETLRERINCESAIRS